MQFALSSHTASSYIALHTAFQRSVAEFYRQHEQADVRKHCVEGSIKLFDAMTLDALLKEHQPKKILEVGSYLGFSTRWLCEASTAWGGQITSVDPRLRHRMFDDIKAHLVQFTAPHADRLTLIDGYLSFRSDDAFLDFYTEYAPTMSIGEATALLKTVKVIDDVFDTFDLCFIDGDHTVASTMANIEHVVRLMPAGGLIITHDAISWPTVRTAMERCAHNEPRLIILGIHGEDFHAWVSENPTLAEFEASRPVRESLCDGIGVIEVKPA